MIFFEKLLFSDTNILITSGRFQRSTELIDMKESKNGDFGPDLPVDGRWGVGGVIDYTPIVCSMSYQRGCCSILETGCLIMSDGEWKPNVIVRVGKGSDKPLDPGHQHKADYTDSFKDIVTNCTIEKLDNIDSLEHYGRENYNLKRDEEDIYIIESRKRSRDCNITHGRTTILLVLDSKWLLI